MKFTAAVSLTFMLMCSGNFRVSAQDYQDYNYDDTYMYVDDFAESLPPASCPTGVQIYDTFVGVSGSASASYPDIAHLAQSAVNGADLEWDRDVTHLGQQRGGNCGVFLETVVYWRVAAGYSFNIFAHTADDGGGGHQYTLIANCNTLCKNVTHSSDASTYPWAYLLEQYSWVQIKKSATSKVTACISSVTKPTDDQGPPSPPAAPGAPWSCYDSYLFQ